MKQKLIEKLIFLLLKKFSKKYVFIKINSDQDPDTEKDITMLSNIKERGLIRILLVRVKNKL